MRSLGYLFWFVLLLLAVVFYRERVIFMDGAFQLFEIINDGWFKIYHYRLPNPLTQVLPVLGVQLGLPLRWVAMLYSVNFILFFAGIYHLLTGWLKNDALGWALIFFCSLLTLDTFFFLPPELYQGNALALLLFGIVHKYPTLRQPGWVMPVLAGLTVVVVFSHKLALVSLLFLWLFFGLHDARFRHRRYLMLLIWALAIAVVHSLFFMDWYDAAKQGEFKYWFWQYFPNFHRIPAHGIFLRNCLKFYYFLPLFLLLVLVFYAWKKQGWKLLLVAVFSMGYVLLLHIGSPDTPHRFYAEASYLPLTLFVTIPLLFDVVPYPFKKTRLRGVSFLIFLQKIKINTPLFKERQRFWVCLFAAILLIRLNAVIDNAANFERRLDWYRAQLDRCDSLHTNRLLLKNSLAPQEVVTMDWATPYETLLLSALEHPDSAKTLFIYPAAEPEKGVTTGDGYFLSVFQKLEVEKLNKRYFNLGKGKYVEIK